MIIKILKRICRLLVLAALVIIVPITGQRGHKHYLYDYKGSSVVRLTGSGMGYRSGGTGFQVLGESGEQYTMTNYHVCMLANSGYLTGEDYKGNKYNLKVLEHSMQHDLCLVEPIRSLRPISLAYNYYLHEQVHLIGHPRLENLTYQSGSIVSKQMIQISLPTLSIHPCKSQFGKSMLMIQNLLFRPKKSKFKRCFESLTVIHINTISYGGNSGSPVVDDFGNLIGVLFAGSPRAVTAAYIVPLEYVKEFLANN